MPTPNSSISDRIGPQGDAPRPSFWAAAEAQSSASARTPRSAANCSAPTSPGAAKPRGPRSSRISAGMGKVQGSDRTDVELGGNNLWTWMRFWVCCQSTLVLGMKPFKATRRKHFPAISAWSPKNGWAKHHLSGKTRESYSKGSSISTCCFLSQAIRWIAMWTWVPNGTEQKF